MPSKRRPAKPRAPRRPAPPTPVSFDINPVLPAPAPEPPLPTGDEQTTGRYLVLLREGSTKSSIDALRKTAGIEVAASSDFDDGSFAFNAGSDAQGVMLESIGVAVVEAPPEQTRALSLAASDDSQILAMESERIVYAAQGSADYLRGYRDAINHLTGKLLGEGTEELAGDIASVAGLSESQLTWGLQLTNVPASRFSGRGIRVAILDTGLDLAHPDFMGRAITSQSFISGESVQDGHGHGTHCIGTACGPRQPTKRPRYGVAFESEIFAGKVLSNAGFGFDGGILAGIEWAITNRCVVASMSLETPVRVGDTFSLIFENVAQRALNAGTLLISVAGNGSKRSKRINPVSHPGNCPSIMAVAAVDQKLRVAEFSNGGINPNGGGVDIAGPGVDVKSAAPRPRLTRTLSGTSMAAPHVAGIAALIAESDPNARGNALWAALLARARRLPLPSSDVGMGLVQAP